MSCLTHLLVFGFHHKKGSILEFIYPDINLAAELPSKWSHLPSIALPDGAHNFSKDSIYFTLPSLSSHSEPVFGVACYRQVDAKDYSSITPEFTRNSIQKSVVLLSRVPLFGFLSAQLEDLTDLFIGAPNADAGCSVLKTGFHEIELSVNDLLKNSDDYESSLHLGLSAVSFLLVYQRDVLILLKLLLLERRILFTCDIPVNYLSTWILTLISLLPGALSGGLNLCTVVDETWIMDRACWPMASQKALSLRKSDEKSAPKVSPDADPAQMADGRKADPETNRIGATGTQKTTAATIWSNLTRTASALSTRVQSVVTAGSQALSPTEVQSNQAIVSKAEESALDLPFSADRCADPWVALPPLDSSGVFDSPLPTDDWGLPLSLFCRSYLLLPYVPLSVLDTILEQAQNAQKTGSSTTPPPKGYRVRGFLAGTTNPLLCQNTKLAEVVVKTLPFPKDPISSVVEAANVEACGASEDVSFEEELFGQSVPDEADSAKQSSDPTSPQPSRRSSVFAKFLQRPQSSVRICPPCDDPLLKLRAMPSSLGQAAQLSRPDRNFIDNLIRTVELWYSAKNHQRRLQSEKQEVKYSSSHVSLSKPENSSGPSDPINNADPAPHDYVTDTRVSSGSDVSSSNAGKLDLIAQSYAAVLLRFPALLALENWVRAQFGVYIKSLLLAADAQIDAASDFNSAFVECFRATHCFLVWRNQFVASILDDERNGCHEHLHEEISTDFFSTPEEETCQATVDFQDAATPSVNTVKNDNPINLPKTSFSLPSPWIHPGRSCSFADSDQFINNLKQFVFPVLITSF